MRLFLLVLGVFAVCLCTGCASSREAARRPSVYLGGQYYGDALHADELAKNDNHSPKGTRN
ncbi:hypothetical protein EV701_102124 [Chthoniobacter flavus]|uniref:hypothetical protein n=1 Tax=Chthoniobacter flavus TaxID=191863 RepID=UPI00104CA187|nr:hypothetical protein [Chthoniobacter flavus]TCO94657.1 hypothetical protein EV701_102124 [Chthoniobacter flavus]